MVERNEDIRSKLQQAAVEATHQYNAIQCTQHKDDEMQSFAARDLPHGRILKNKYKKCHGL